MTTRSFIPKMENTTTDRSQLNPFSCNQFKICHHSIGQVLTADCLICGAPFPVRSAYESLIPLRRPLPSYCVPPCYQPDWYTLPAIKGPVETTDALFKCSKYDDHMDTHFRHRGKYAPYRIYSSSKELPRTSTNRFTDHLVNIVHPDPGNHCSAGRHGCDVSLFELPPCQGGVRCEDVWPHEMRKHMDQKIPHRVRGTCQ